MKRSCTKSFSDTVRHSHCFFYNCCEVPMAAVTSHDGKTVATVDWCGFGCVGSALDSRCRQNSWILSNKHYGSVGRAAGGWTPRLCCKSNCCLSSDGCFLANTTLGSSDVNLMVLTSHIKTNYLAKRLCND